MTNWTRVVMNRETRRLVNELSISSLDVMEISGSAWSDIAFRSYVATEYPGFDICAVKEPKPTFDLIIAEQVFEHILWPYRAGRNVFALLRPGGHFLVTTPFMLPIHEVPHDCTRWTCTGMKHFLAECGFPLDDVQAFSWGNSACVKANLKGWIPYSPWKHSLRNSPKHPVVVWAIARKASLS